MPLPPGLESMVLLYGSTELYFAVLPAMGDEMTRAAIRASMGVWGTGIKSSSAFIPEQEIQYTSFFNELVERAELVFFPAFDGDGFLVWEPI